MRRRIAALSAVLWVAAGAVVAAGAAVPQAQNAWTLPADAAEQISPVQVTAATLNAGRVLFREHCARCHGPEAKGNGSDANPKFAREMDLTSAARADRNPDGVVFHKIWNGREKPRMPAFRTKITAEQAWMLVGYVQSLRAKS